MNGKREADYKYGTMFAITNRFFSSVRHRGQTNVAKATLQDP